MGRTAPEFIAEENPGRRVLPDQKWARALVGAFVGGGVGAFVARYSVFHGPTDVFGMSDVGFFEAIATGYLMGWLHLHAPDEPYLTIAYALVFAILAALLAAFQ